MDEAIFRPMQKQDVARVAQLERMCFRSPWSENSLRGELKNKLAHYTVLELCGTVIGYAGMWVLFSEAHITNVAIHPDFRRRGLGRELMRHMMEDALGLGANRMTLEVREHNLPAQTLYFSMGFATAGRRKGYYSDSGEDALILWQDDIAAYLGGIDNGTAE